MFSLKSQGGLFFWGIPKAIAFYPTHCQEAFSKLSKAWEAFLWHCSIYILSNTKGSVLLFLLKPSALINFSSPYVFFLYTPPFWGLNCQLLTGHMWTKISMVSRTLSGDRRLHFALEAHASFSSQKSPGSYFERWFSFLWLIGQLFPLTVCEMATGR